MGVCDDILSSSELPTLPFVFKGNFYVCGWRTSLSTRPTKRKSKKRVFKNHQNRHSIYRKNCQFLRVEHHVLNWLTLPLKFQIHSEEIWFWFVWFPKIAEALTKSQFPVYTIYAQRICLANASELCAQRSWAYEMVPSFEMSTFVRQKKQAATRRACMELCLNEQTFQCRYD